MATLTESAIESLLEPYLTTPLPGEFAAKPRMAGVQPVQWLASLSAYLELLLRWNERTNLTAIREPEEIVRRHFGESLFTGRLLAAVLGKGAHILDIGSGAGFPGLPVQLYLPGAAVVLAESQGKKAAFLREAVRATGAKAEVWAARAQDLPKERRFDAVLMRAVDRPEQALAEAGHRLAPGGHLLHLCGTQARENATWVRMPGLNAGGIEVSR